MTFSFYYYTKEIFLYININNKSKFKNLDINLSYYKKNFEKYNNIIFLANILNINKKN